MLLDAREGEYDRSSGGTLGDAMCGVGDASVDVKGGWAVCGGYGGGGRGSI